MAVLRLDRANPDLKDLLPTAQIGIGLKLKHAAGKVLDVRIVAIVQTARFAQTLVEIAVTRTMLAEVGSDNRQRRPVFVGPSDANRKAQRDSGRASLALHNLYFRSRKLRWRVNPDDAGFARRQFFEIRLHNFGKNLRIAGRQP